ncbi:MAG: hypothetical protein CW336_02300 [Bacteroidetes bacterium]|nr:hypothetical protein [Bacteroidota bacterium]
MKSIRLNIGKVAMMFMLIMTVFVSEIQAQVVDDSNTHRPKVGVVLCGGGAKGFAQIRILKALDEAGVPIDYIGGTSIGSIIGALYAVGYDPDMIEKLVREQDWNQVLYDKFSEELMPIDRRMNERRYLATFPITNGKMKVKSAFVEGVYVNMLLSRLMLPAHNIQDYSKLSVPFYCIATDVEHACQYEMTSGSLSRSVRASMSIPFLFQPVTIDGRLLIDGGMVNNFPVRNMKEHGADIIIGIDLEDESIPASQIDNSLQLFTSLMNLSSLEESLYARSHCNIYIKPNLHGRDMLSFNDFDSIIQFGQDAADKFYPQFQRLADSLQNLGHFEINRPHVQPVEKIKIVGINVEGIPENHKHSFARLYATEFPATVTLDQIEEMIVKLKISGYYDNLWYYISDAPDGYILNIHCDEVADKSMSAAIHYDNNYGIGALVNFTFNNVMKSIDRSTISLDVNIAENPYIKGHFNTQMGKYFRMGADLSFYSVDISQYDDNQMTNSYSIQDNNLDLYMQLIPTVKQQFRLGAVADYVHMKDFVGDNQLNSDYHFYSYLYLNYFYKNEDAPSFARRGWKIDITGKCVFFEGVNNEGVLTSNGWQNSIILHGNIIKSSSIGKKSSLKLGVEAGYKVGTSDIPVFYKFFVGGQSKMKYFDNIIAFTGLDFIDKVVDYVAMGKMAWQWNFYKKLYFTASVDAGFINDAYDLWFDSNSFVAGGGITFGVDTMVGPVEVSLMGSNINSAPVGFINVGFWY